MPDKERLEDQLIEEALGRNAPPDLRSRILGAAQGSLADAPTPPQGTPSARMRRATSAVTRPINEPKPRPSRPVYKPQRNWAGAAVVAGFCAVFAVALTLFVVYSGDPADVQIPDAGPSASENPEHPIHEPGRRNDARDGQAPVDPTGTKPVPEPPEPKEEKAPDPQPESRLPEGKPESQPAIETPETPPKKEPVDTPPEPESKPEPAPEPEPKRESVEKPDADEPGTEAKPDTRAVVATFEAPPVGQKRYDYFTRRNADEKWREVHGLSGAWGVRKTEDGAYFEVLEGTELKVTGAPLTLANDALLHAEGEFAIKGAAEAITIELYNDRIYVDCLGLLTAVHVSRSGLLVEVTGAGILEAGRDKLELFCTDGEFKVGADTLTAGQCATLSDRGLSRRRDATKRDWSDTLLRTLPSRLLHGEGFETEPAGKMITGTREARDAATLGADRDGFVAAGNGLDAGVSFQFDGLHTQLSGEVIRVRYRARGANKLIVQCWNPDAKDNFGIDLTPGKAGEWHVLEIRMSDLRDRETMKVGASAGARYTSFGFHTTGTETELEVDWVEFVRAPRYED
ncbi:MAG: hypothetical protein IPK87_16945 [Planctomycetes bacterium]|nr:hypothetical protein [Planctomycetota bacterium]